MGTFGERLKGLRNERGISQNELSKYIGVSKSSVNMYERGEREPGFETLEAIADFFNINMDYLLGRGSRISRNTSEIGADVICSYIHSFTTLQVCENRITDDCGVDLTKNLKWKRLKNDIPISYDEENFILLLKRIHRALGVYFSFDDKKEILLIVDKEKIPGPILPGIFTFGGKSYVKKLDNGKLFPVQSSHPVIPKPDDTQCAGTVIGYIGTHLFEDFTADEPHE